MRGRTRLVIRVSAYNSRKCLGQKRQLLRALRVSVVNLTLTCRTLPKPQRRERRQIAIRRAATQQLSHHMRGDRRQQDPIAIVSGGSEISGQRGWSDDGQIIRTSRPQTRPNFVDAHLGDRRRHIRGGLGAVAEPSRDRHACRSRPLPQLHLARCVRRCGE